jgi:GNAT superfamily N-acetyltransferase
MRPRGGWLTVAESGSGRSAVRCAGLVEAIQTADPDTLRARFLDGAPHLNPRLLDSLTQLDYTARFALVARARGRGTAVARYASLPPDPDGKVAGVVDPAWRRVGLATMLVTLLAQRAHECGIDTFTAIFSSENRPVAELARDVHAGVSVADGISQLEFGLGQGAGLGWHRWRGRAGDSVEDSDS